MKIKTDSTPLEEPKNPDTCNLFALYKLLASDAEIAEMRANYEGGNYGYGTAKQTFYDLLITKFAEERTRYNYYMENLEEVDKALAIGAEKAKVVAADVLKRVREKLGY
jgi:tryptophanyl-tRNA synthetase